MIQMPKQKMSKRHKNLDVKRSQLQEGVDLCKTNVSTYLIETNLLISQGYLGHAVIFTEFAIEELGKALLIKEAFRFDQNDPFKIEASKFYNHDTKIDFAWDILDKKYQILFDEGVCYPNTLFERGCVDEYTLADLEGRLRTAFVDYCSSQWLLERKIKEDLLKGLVGEIQNKLLQV
jgi:hypothetical protein